MSFVPRRAVFLLGLMSCLVAATIAGPALRGADTARASHGLLPFVGVTLNFTDATANVIAERAGTRGARVGAATIEVHWDTLERSASANGNVAAWDSGDLGTLDARINAVYQNGVTPVLIVGWAPPWAAPSKRAPLYDNATFARFMQALVSRYKDRVHHYFLWLEPDYSPTGPDVDRRAYGPNGAALAQLFNQVTPEIKAIDPNAKVMLGPVAHDAFINSDALMVNGSPRNAGGPFHYSFLESFLRAVNPSAIDALGLNAYPGGFAESWEQADPGGSVEVAAKYAHVRSRLGAYNSSLADLPIVYGEAGLWRGGDPPNDAVYLTDESGNGSLLYPCGHPLDRCLPVNEETQAQYIPKLYARAKDAGVESVVHYTFDQVEYDGTRGVVRSDGSLAPGYYALQYASRIFSSAVRDPSAPALVTVTNGLVERYGLVSSGNSIVVAWARGTLNPTGRVSAPAGSTARDKLGNPVQGTDEGGRVAFDLTSSPLYIGVGHNQLPDPASSAQRIPGAFTQWVPLLPNRWQGAAS